jgi:O-antigen/teichoic acid export membrane protein
MARFGRDMLVYAGADLLGSSIGLILSPLFTRLFSPEQYGAQAALAAIWGFVGLAQYGGMDSAYSFTRASVSDTDVRRRVLVTASFVAVVSALVVSGAFFAVSLATDWVTGFTGVSRGEVASFAFTLIPGAVMAWFLYVLRFERCAPAFARVSLLGRVGGSLLVIPMLMISLPADRLKVGFLVTGGVAALAAVWGWRELKRIGLSPFSSELFDRERARDMLRYGLVLVPASALYAASTVLDRLLVTWFCGQADTAVLALALRLGAVAAMLRTWFALVWDPQLVDWIAVLPRDELMAKLKEAAGLIARVASMLVGLAAVWSQPVVTWLYPPAYWAAVPLIPWIVLGVAVSGLSIVAVATIIIAKRPKFCLPVYLLGLLVNVSVGLWAVPKFGVNGAIAGALSGEICILGAWIYIGTRHFRNVPLSWISRLLMVAAAGGFVALYRPGYFLPGSFLAERILVSAVVIALLGLPVARHLWNHRKQLHH